MKNSFKRGGEKELKNQLFGPPIGSLFLHGGKFPTLYILIRRDGKDRGIFLPLGLFKGGGGRKTKFFFVKSRELYSREYKWMKPIKPYLWEIIQDTITTFDSYHCKWEYIHQDIGIKPIMPEFG